MKGMKRENYEKMVAAARDIVAKSETCPDLDPLTVEWARALMIANPYKYTSSPLQDSIMALYDDDPAAGLNAREIQERIGKHGDNVNGAISNMVTKGKLFMLKKPHRSRYFSSATACEAGRAAFEREIQTPRPPKVRPRRAPKPPRPLKTIAELAHSIVARKQTAFMPPTLGFPPARRTVLDSGEAFRPDNAPVPIQQLPHQADTRYLPDEPAPGGFMDEWKKLRGESA
jgi:hypothetical protein